MINRLWFMLATLAVGCLSACGGSGGSGDDTGGVSAKACEVIGLTTKIVNGETCDNLGASSIVRIAFGLRTGRDNFFQSVCSGTLIAPDAVLTAAHCFPGSFSAAGSGDVGVEIGDEGKRTFIPARSVVVHPNFGRDPNRSGRAINDAAVVLLSAPLPLPTLPILTSRDPTSGELGFVYGYGQRAIGESDSIDEASVDFSTLQAGTMSVTSVTPEHVFVTFDGTGSNVCFGDSGGPIVVYADGSPAIAGIVSGGSRSDCGVGDVTSFTNLRTANVLDFIRASVPSFSIR